MSEIETAVAKLQIEDLTKELSKKDNHIEDLARQVNELGDQLNTLRGEYAGDRYDWIQKRERLEEEIKQLKETIVQQAMNKQESAPQLSAPDVIHMINKMIRGYEAGTR